MINNQPMTDADRESQALAALYNEILARQEAARRRRIARGEATYSDLDEDGRRAYMRRKQAESRARRKALAQRTGAAPLDASSIRDALADAVMAMLAAGDARADAVLALASKAFEFPDVAAAHIRRKAAKAKPKVLTPDRLQ